MSARFSASHVWVSSAFGELEAMLEDHCQEEADVQVEGLAWIIALLRHDSFESEERYQENYRSLRARYAGDALSDRLRLAASGSTLREIMKRACGLTGHSPAVRTSGVGIVTRNAFSADFLPPEPMRAKLAIDAWFERRLVPAGPNGTIGRALASYLVFLTIHPLKDGNGRMARMLFAADHAQRIANMPRHVLALILLQREQRQPFHLAAKCARVGDFQMLASCYLEALDMASRGFGDLLAELGSNAVDNEGATSQAPVAMEIHRRLGMALAGPRATSLF